MLYFVVAGKNEKLAEYELRLIGKIRGKNGKIFFVELNDDKLLTKLSFFVKGGIVVDKDKVVDLIRGVKLVGVNRKLSTDEKEFFGIKRFKLIKLMSSDLEVKKKGKELFFFNDNKVGVVTFYQNISLYETIDFGKPVRGMKIGMMPAKLAHFLINISTKFNYGQTIYDSFSGFGTTAMLANYLENNVLASDINITPTKQNWKWRTTTEFYKENYKHFFFKHDITFPIKNKVANFANIVVSEGYLGPVVKKFLTQKQAEENFKKIEKIYYLGIKNLFLLKNLQLVAITFPVYILANHSKLFLNSLYEKLSFEFDLKIFDELYLRKGQKVGRQIGLIKKKTAL